MSRAASRFRALLALALLIPGGPLLAQDYFAEESFYTPADVFREVGMRSAHPADSAGPGGSFVATGGDSYSIMEGRPDTHAPAGVMGDHFHEPGEFMVEYKLMHMEMNGNRFGTTRVSNVAALDVTGISFAATPISMTMDMHMLHLMYGFTENMTLWLMPMYMEAEMNHLRRPGSMPAAVRGPTFTTLNSGFGDTAFGGLVRLYEGNTDILLLNAGWSVPTGNINHRTSTPTGMPGEFPYPMRLGSGSFNAIPTLTYKQFWQTNHMGVQLGANLPTHKNFSGYANPNQFWATSWFSQVIGESTVLSFRTEGAWRGDVAGADPQLNPMMISTANPNMRGGEWINLGYGGMYQFFDGSRLNVELVQPVYQNLRGVQLETDLTLWASWSKAW
ncbi:MAG: transporter [Pirellulaceae bacterium]